MVINRLKRKFIKAVREIYYDMFSGVIKTFPLYNEEPVRILIYHGVSSSDPLKFNSRFISQENFEEHLKAIKKFFNPISLEDYKLKKFSKDKLNVMLTFDDGLKNNYELALPLLKKYSVPAVFFITMPHSRSVILFNDLLDVFSFTGPDSVTINNINFTKRRYYIHWRYFSDKGEIISSCFQDTNLEEKKRIEEQIFTFVKNKDLLEYSEYLSLMNEEEIRGIRATEGMSIGSHGVSHSDFAKLTTSELEKELKVSKKKLEEITSYPCETVAFPYGNYDDATLKLCKELRYTYLFGTEKLHKLEDRNRVIERMTVNPFISTINQMYYIAKNSYE